MGARLRAGSQRAGAPGGNWNTTTFIVPLLIRWGAGSLEKHSYGVKPPRPGTGRGGDELRRQCLAGSLAGAVHLSKGNAGVLRWAQRGQKPRAEQKGKSSLDFDFQYEYRPWKRGLSILLTLRVLSKRCQKSHRRDNWLVAAKRS